MNPSPRHQQGLTLISLVFMLVAIGGIVLLALNIAPIYLNHSKVTSSLSDLTKTIAVSEISQADIRESLNKRFKMNDVYDVAQDDITITKYGNYFQVTISYKVVRKIVGNLSVLVQFNDSVEVSEK